MRILIATGIYPPDIGGPATYSFLLAKELPKKGIEVEIITYGPAGISRKIPKGLRHLIYFITCFKKALRSDIVYAQGVVSSGLPAMLVSKILRKKFIVKIVGDYAWEQGVGRFDVKDLIEKFQKKKYSWQVELLRKIQKWVTKKADKIVVPSKFLRKIISGWGVKPKKIKVIYNAFDSKHKIKAGKEKENFLISVGRLVPWKGFDVLIEILKELPEGIGLKIVGIGSEEKKLKKLVSKLGLEKKVEFLGKLEHKKLLQLMNKSGIFVLNTGYEGFSHIILEAMAMSLPVITTNVCGNPEIVKDEQNGLLVEYNDKKQLKEAILKLWKDKDLQRKFIKNGKETLEKFTLEKMIDETIRALKM